MTFTEVLNRSISAGWLILAIALFRLLLKQAPKALHCALWALVAVRLLCPVSIESEWSLIPSREVIPQQYLVTEQSDSQAPAALEIVTNPIYDVPITVDTPVTVASFQNWDLLATIIWLGGMGLMGIYALYSYLSLRLQVRMAGWVRKNIYECDEIGTPFILGLFWPRIYLPSGLDTVTKSHVLAHENAHLKRLDHLWKPLGFALLALHWFNPVIWLGYWLLCRDIELACDEKVVRDLEKGAVRSYSEALVRCSLPHRTVTMCPLAFGEVSVKSRIKTMLHYKKPAFWVLVPALLTAATLAVCFLTDPLTPENSVDTLLHRDDCAVVSCQEQTIKLQISKSDLPENVLNGKTHSFADDPVLVLEYDNTSLYLTEARMSGDELLVTFTVEHNLPDSGSILLPYHPFSDDAGMEVHATHADVSDAEGLYGNAMTVRGKGKDSFSVGIKMDVWNQSKEYVRFQLEGMYALCYVTGSKPTLMDAACLYTMEGADLLGPRFRLNPDGTFHFSSNPLSSYLGVGQYTLTAGRLVMKTDDERYIWTFDLKNGDFLFDAEHSSIVQWYPDLKNPQILPDGVRFVQSPVYQNEVEMLIEIICSSPLQSSNPGDYIEAHHSEYDHLVELEHITVYWCFHQFANGNQTDLRGHIMALLCRDIISRSESMTTEEICWTGQDWFDAFVEQAIALREELGEPEFSASHLWHAMALEILGI